MRRDLKRQIKQDELVSGLERVAKWIAEHRNLARNAAIGVLLAAVGSSAFVYWRSQRTRQAEREFSAALEIFEAPVRDELPEGASLPPGPIYSTAGEKYKKAIAAFDGLERRFPSDPVGLRARYYSAVCRGEAGDFKEAERLLSEIAARTDSKALEPALSRLGLADLQRRSGQTDKAVAAYRKLVDDPNWPLPKDHVLMSLASTLDEASRPVEARRSYRQLVDEFPASVYAAEARRRADYLETAG